MRVVLVLWMLAGACTPPPIIRPAEIIPKGRVMGGVSLAVAIAPSPAPGLGRGDGFDINATTRTGINSRCDFAFGLGVMLAISVDARCALLSHRRGDPLTLIPFASSGYNWIAGISSSAELGYVARAGFDVAPPLDSWKPVASFALATLAAEYTDTTRPPSPDGPFDPSAFRRELRLEAQLGVQLGAYDRDWAFTVAVAPFWILSDPHARPDGFAILVGAGGSPH
jgi:hypothetical protein